MESADVVALWRLLCDAVNSIEVTTLSSVYKLFLSLVLGSVVGYERKQKGQPAGLRTFALIAMGSTLAMILSIYVPQEYLGLKNGDPGRIAAQVVTGIGFLGAGAIIQMKGSVRGLTTAAGIWMVAAIGMAVGVGMYVIAVIATVFIMLILRWLDKFEHRVNIGTELRTLTIRVADIVNNLNEYREVLGRHHISVMRFNIDYNFEKRKTFITFIILIPEGADQLSVVDDLCAMYTTESISLTNQT